VIFCVGLPKTSVLCADPHEGTLRRTKNSGENTGGFECRAVVLVGDKILNIMTL
jgi:hypothetical protein